MRPLPSLIVLSACVSALGCAPDDASPDARETSSESELRGVGKRVCKGAFFDAHPVQTVFTDSAGGKLPMPFAACDVSMTLVVGTADYAKIAARTAGSGYSPVKLSGGKAAVVLYLTDFVRSDVGRYRELAATYPVLPDAIAQAAPEVPWVNELSSTVPLFIPGVTTFFDRLQLDQSNAGTQATRSGIETVGLDKRQGQVSIQSSPTQTYFVVSDETGRGIVGGYAPVNPDLLAQYAEATKLAHALGLPDAMSLPPMPPELVVPLANVDKRTPGKVWSWAAIINQPAPKFTSLPPANRIRVNPSSELGGILYGARFAATATIRYDDADIVYAIPAGWP